MHGANNLTRSNRKRASINYSAVTRLGEPRLARRTLFCTCWTSPGEPIGPRRNQQTLHRVRLGPIGSPGEVQQVQNSVRLANLGSPSLVTAE